VIYHVLEDALHIPWVFQAAVLAALILLACGALVRHQLAAAGGGLLPDEGVTLRNVFEVMVEGLAGLARDTMGAEWHRYFPLVATIFVFVLTSNLLGLVPGVGGASSDVNTAAAWAIIAFGTYNVVGIRTHGWRYIYQFMGPSLVEAKLFGRHFHVRLLAPLMLPLELILHGARIVTLSVRLIANMFADHTVIGVWVMLVPFAVPAVFMGLGLLVAVLQAFVFSLLTMIYIGLAQEEPH
jgi:F-type H+-transporting ATPase subunit a